MIQVVQSYFGLLFPFRASWPWEYTAQVMLSLPTGPKNSALRLVAGRSRFVILQKCSYFMAEEKWKLKVGGFFNERTELMGEKQPCNSDFIGN